MLFASPPAIRRVLYTANAIESLNYSLRKVLKGRGAFPNDESIVKLWTQPIRDWKAPLNQFVMLFGERARSSESNLRLLNQSGYPDTPLFFRRERYMVGQA